MATKIQGDASGNVQEVDSNKNAQVVTPGFTAAGVARGGGNNAAPAIFSEVDGGTRTSVRYTVSPEADDDFRLRVSGETWLDDENFNYTAQNTGKHQLQNTTQTITLSAAGLLTNASAITTTTTGCSYRTYAMFPIIGMGQTTYIQFSASFSALPTANSVIDYGLFLQPTTNPFVPTDGVYFRQDSIGLKGVINNNGTETETNLSYTYAANTVYKFTISASETQTCFWINDILCARVVTPIGQSAPCLSTALPMGIRQAFVGAAGTAIQMLVKEYSISTGGSLFAESLGQRGNAVYGSYQGLSGGTMGSLSTYTNNTNPTAAVPSNTALTANLPSGLGGQAWETFTLAVNTDGILLSYQVPSGTLAIAGKRLKITGVKLSSFIQTVLAGGPLNRTFSLNFGHTAVSLATAEAATTKARRVVLLPELTQTVTAAQAVNTIVAQVAPVSLFDQPIYVNPGEFISLSVKHIGTVGTSGTIATNIQYIYSWE
jgi:hypothetical protein